MTKTYNYTNDLGYHKTLAVEFPPIEGKYACSLWCADTGDYCGGGNATAEQIEQILNHYGLHFDIGD